VPFEPVDPKVSFPELERGILAFWREADVFRRSLELRADAPRWIFYEGPPTANGKPGIHHVEARSFKDVYPRYRTMAGYQVPRKGGWDCHGLPVELEVEKQIGTNTKRDIEAFGIERFNELCRASVTRYVDDWARLTERIGFWIDLGDAYRTMDPAYVESVWWSLKTLHARGLLYEDDRSVAYCPRCGTGLSDHEVSLGYRHTTDPGVTVRFPVVEPTEEALAGASILAWTTTPWTLPSNEGLAVAADERYAIVEAEGGERFVVAETLRERVLGGGSRVAAEVGGAALVGTRYEPLYPNVDGAHVVVAAEFVSMDEGTGVVHVAPGFGPDDLELGRREGWPTFKPIDDSGRFTDQAPAFVRGLFVKDADDAIVEDLRARGLLLRAEPYEHTYPFCWRCDTPLLYVARTSWYVRTTAMKERLLEVNEETNWFPPHIQHGRYGDWLENNVDWALSRERYWGTPLPIWRCAEAHQTAIGSLRELGDLAGRDVGDLDPHRPAIDEVTFPCPTCGGTATRVPEVIDAWYDSGAMPFAQWGYHPELGRGREEFERAFPADFISEAIDQTRGWFYSLMAESTLLFDRGSYRNVVCLGLLVDEDGRKMSTRLGNVMDPWEVIDEVGADATRWLLLAGGSPWADRRMDLGLFREVVRQVLLTLWNVLGFFVTYANADGFDPGAAPAPPLAERPLLDRWIASRVARTVRAAREGLDAYDATGAGRAIQALVEDLSNWYVRRSRRRFWDPAAAGTDDARAAFHTLHEALVTIAQLLAPFTPFVAEAIWRNLAAGRDGRPDSVHLSDYPTAVEGAEDGALEDAMADARAIVELGRRVRVETKTRTRQPLAEAIVHDPRDHAALEPLLDVVAEELNVKRVAFAESLRDVGRWRAKPNYRVLGRRVGAAVKEVAAALEADDGGLAAAFARGEGAIVAGLELAPGDVDLSQEVREGWGVASEGGLAVALDLEVTHELRLEGLARELVRRIQDERRGAGLEVSDRIVLGVRATGEVADALAAHRDHVARETLAVEVIEGDAPGAASRTVDVEGEPVGVSLKKA